MQTMSQPRLRIALQKSGKLSTGSLELLQQGGVLSQCEAQSLWVQSTQYAADFMFVRDDDIPTLLTQGICDLGVIGQNVLTEYRLNDEKNSNVLEPILSLGFAKCRLSIAVPKDARFTSIRDLEGSVIATSYPNTLKDFLMAQNIQASIITLQGSVELAPKIGMADAICDLVSTGKTLHENNLIELQTILESEAMLVAKEQNGLTRKEMINRFMARVKKVVSKK